MTKHIITISCDEQCRQDACRWRVTCTVEGGCGGWMECGEPHEVDGISAADGPHDCDPDAPWADCDEFTFHGVDHEWRVGYGWTVDYDGCPITPWHFDLPDGIDTTRNGSWLVENEWDDTDCLVELIRELRGEDQ